MCICSLQAGSLAVILQGNGLRKSEPACGLLIFEYPLLTDGVI